MLEPAISIYQARVAHQGPARAGRNWTQCTRVYREDLSTYGNAAGCAHCIATELFAIMNPRAWHWRLLGSRATPVSSGTMLRLLPLPASMNWHTLRNGLIHSPLWTAWG